MCIIFSDDMNDFKGIVSRFFAVAPAIIYKQYRYGMAVKNETTTFCLSGKNGTCTEWHRLNDETSLL